MRKRFLYYIPGLAPAECSQRVLSERGLFSRFVAPGDVGLTENSLTPVSVGPDGAHGCILALGARPGEYDPVRQTWEKFSEFWIGYENDFMPGAPDLVREYGFVGYELKLIDECVWTVPLLRHWDRNLCEPTTSLPKVLKPVEGRLKKVVSPQYEHLDMMAEKIWQSFISKELLPVETVFEMCAKLMAVNYRIGLEEFGMLGLVDAELAVKMLTLCIDAPAMMHHVSELELDGIKISQPKSDGESAHG